MTGLPEFEELAPTPAQLAAADSAADAMEAAAVRVRGCGEYVVVSSGPLAALLEDCARDARMVGPSPYADQLARSLLRGVDRAGPPT